VLLGDWSVAKRFSLGWTRHGVQVSPGELEDYLLPSPYRLGVKNLMLFLKALLGKWLWKFVEEDKSLWTQMIVEKYGVQRGNWCSKEAQGPYSIFGGILETAGVFL
jgi:hypothetical protein